MPSNNSKDYGYNSAEVVGYSMCAALCGVCKKATWTDERYQRLACSVTENGCAALVRQGERICQSFDILPAYEKKLVEKIMNDECDYEPPEKCYCHHPNVSAPCSYCEGHGKMSHTQRKARSDKRIYKLIFIGCMPKLISHNRRKARSDATVEFMIRQYQGQTMWASSLSAVFHGTTMSDRRRFLFECRKRGVEVQN